MPDCTGECRTPYAPFDRKVVASYTSSDDIAKGVYVYRLANGPNLGEFTFASFSGLSQYGSGCSNVVNKVAESYATKPLTLPGDITYPFAAPISIKGN